MFHTPKNMQITVTTVRRLLSTARFSKPRKVPNWTTSLARGFCHRTFQPRLPQLISTSRRLSPDVPIVPRSIVDGVILRSYATTTEKGTTKKTSAKKKAKKPAKKKVVAKRKVAKKPVKPTRPKVLNIPSARGLSGYTVFIQHQLKSSTGSSPTTRLSDAVKEWNALSFYEKETWKTRAEEVNTSRKREYENFVSKMSPSEIKEENAKRRTLKKNFKSSGSRTRLIKDPNAPKRPISAYLRFFTEHVTPGVSVKEAAKEASQRWKSMSDDEKRPYVQAHEADKSRYSSEMKAYHSS